MFWNNEEFPKFPELKDISVEKFVKKHYNIEIWDVVHLYHNENKQGIKDTGTVYEIRPQWLYQPAIAIQCSWCGYSSDDLQKFEVVRKFSDKTLKNIFSLDLDDVFMSRKGELLKVSIQDPHKSHRSFFMKYKNHLENKIYETELYNMIDFVEKECLHWLYIEKEDFSISDFLSKKLYEKVGHKFWNEEITKKMKIYNKDKKLIAEILDFWISLYEPETREYLNKEGVFQSKSICLFQEDLNRLNLGNEYKVINSKNFIKINWKLYPKDELIKTIETSFKNYDYFEKNFSNEVINKPKFDILYV